MCMRTIGLFDTIPAALMLAATCLLVGPSAGAAGLDPGNGMAYNQDDFADVSAEAYDRFGWAIAAGDFDCDGKTDYAIGMPRENVGNLADAGVVQILYGDDAGQVTLWHQDVDGIVGDAEKGDQFGYALAVGDFDDKNCDDLAIGIPFEDVDGDTVIDAGAVQILYGRQTVGLSATGDQLWFQGGGIAGKAEPRDQFGFSLAAGNFGDGARTPGSRLRHVTDLAIGVPREDVGDPAVEDAGAVHILYGSSTGLKAAGNRIFHQGAGGLRGKAERYDLFGWALVAANFDDGSASSRFDDLAVGIPYEDLGDVEDGGAVQILYGSADGLHGDRAGLQIFSQEHDAIQGAAEDGDWFGFSLAAADFDGDRHADLAVGIPLEDLTQGGVANKIRDAGAVQIFYGRSGGLKTNANHILSQSGAAKGNIEKNDELGRSLAAGNFDGNKYHDLAVGVPLEDIGVEQPIENAGAVNIFYGSSGGLGAERSQIISQGPTGVAVSEMNDHFGFTLCADQRNGSAIDSLAVGVPRETLGTGDDQVREAGAVIIIPGSN